MERAVEVLATIHLLIVGPSHMLQPRAWVDFFTCSRARVAPERAHELVAVGAVHVAIAGVLAWSLRLR